MRFDLYSRAIGVLIALALFGSLCAAQTKRRRRRQPGNRRQGSVWRRDSQCARATGQRTVSPNQRRRRINEAKLVLTASLPVATRYTWKQLDSKRETSTSRTFTRDRIEPK